MPSMWHTRRPVCDNNLMTHCETECTGLTTHLSDHWNTGEGFPPSPSSPIRNWSSCPPSMRQTRPSSHPYPQTGILWWEEKISLLFRESKQVSVKILVIVFSKWEQLRHNDPLHALLSQLVVLHAWHVWLTSRNLVCFQWTNCIGIDMFADYYHDVHGNMESFNVYDYCVPEFWSTSVMVYGFWSLASTSRHHWKGV